jgi:hypothetical protein
MSPADQRSADSPRGFTTEQVHGGASANVLRRRGVLRQELGDGGLRGNLFDF